jgi:putative sterol carrier protein
MAHRPRSYLADVLECDAARFLAWTIQYSGRKARGQANERVRRTMRDWNCLMRLQATDEDASFTVDIKSGELRPVEDGLRDTPDLIVRGSSEDLANIFWGDEDPASNCMQGAIQTQGSQEDILRLDAMALLIFLDK